MEESIAGLDATAQAPNGFDRAGQLASMRRPGRPRGVPNMHSKAPSGIAKRLKAAGVDWVRDFAAAVKANDVKRMELWARMAPYLVVRPGFRQPNKKRARASRAAMELLEEMEGRDGAV